MKALLLQKMREKLTPALEELGFSLIPLSEEDAIGSDLKLLFLFGGLQ